jgi:hypothetical protein
MKHLRKYNESKLSKNKEIFEDLKDSFIDLIDVDPEFDETEHLLFRNTKKLDRHYYPMITIDEEFKEFDEIELYIGFNEINTDSEDPSTILEEKIKYYENISNFLKNVNLSIKQFLSIHNNFDFEIDYDIKRRYVKIKFNKVR